MPFFEDPDFRAITGFPDATSAYGTEEFSSVLNFFDIENDGAGIGIVINKRKIVDEPEICLVPDTDHRGKTNFFG